MTLIAIFIPIALGWLVAIGVETSKGWKPPYHLGGWRDLHIFVRCAVILVAATVVKEWLNESPLVGISQALAKGLLFLQVILSCALAISILLYVLAGHFALALCERMGLTSTDIGALNDGESLQALEAFGRVDAWVRRVRAGLAVELRHPSSPVTPSQPPRPSTVSPATHPEVGRCGECASEFTFWVFGCGMANATYAYCTDCGMTAMLYLYHDKLPKDLPPQGLRPISPEGEPYLRACECGGHFSGRAVPRCPSCRAPIEPDAATDFIEATTPLEKRGWWCRSWHRHSGILINNRVVYDHWRSTGANDHVLAARSLEP